MTKIRQGVIRMKSLVNETVSHDKFGTGKIVEETALKIRVQFFGTEQPKIFAFPIAFEKFLVLEDTNLQEECRKLAQKKREELEQAEAERLAKIRRIVDENHRERMEALKKKRQPGRGRPKTIGTAATEPKSDTKK